MIAITGATGQLGRLVMDKLLETTPASEIVAAVRSPEKAADLAARGVVVRRADYEKPETLEAAFAGVERLLLISSSEVGRRAAQHRNVIEAAKKAGVELIAYTSLLHATSSPLGLREEHVATENMLRESGLGYVLLRHGWYTENFTGGIPAALELGVILGCAGDGRIASAARADYAAADVVAITGEGQDGSIYELAGDTAYTLAEFAAEVAQRSGKPVAYQDLTEEEYWDALLKAGLPEPIAAMLADSQAGAAKDGLFDDGKQLSALIGRPTTTLGESVRVALQG